MKAVRKRIQRLTPKQGQQAVLLLGPYASNIDLRIISPRRAGIDCTMKNGLLVCFGSLLAVQQFLEHPERDIIAFAPYGSHPSHLWASLGG